MRGGCMRVISEFGIGPHSEASFRQAARSPVAPARFLASSASGRSHSAVGIQIHRLPSRLRRSRGRWTQSTSILLLTFWLLSQIGLYGNHFIGFARRHLRMSEWQVEGVSSPLTLP